MQVNFYLKDYKEKSTMIFMFGSYNSMRLKYSTGVKVFPEHWNKKNTGTMQITSKDKGFKQKRKLLEKMETVLKEEYSRILNNTEEIPDKEYFKDFLNSKFKNTAQTDSKTFFDYLDEFIAYKQKNGITVKRYVILKTHLKNIEIQQNKKISFKELTPKFVLTFIDFLIANKQQNNTIKANVLIQSLIFMVKKYLMFSNGGITIPD